jgi:hypothetical protein
MRGDECGTDSGISGGERDDWGRAEVKGRRKKEEGRRKKEEVADQRSCSCKQVLKAN